MKILRTDIIDGQLTHTIETRATMKLFHAVIREPEIYNRIGYTESAINELIMMSQEGRTISDTEIDEVLMRAGYDMITDRWAYCFVDYLYQKETWAKAAD